MRRLTLRLPETLHQKLASLAEEEGVSLNHLIVYALDAASHIGVYRYDLCQRWCGNKKKRRTLRYCKSLGPASL